MNSMLQQLYHVPAFRYQLLMADDGAAPDWQEYKGRTIDDNVLHQLQRLFGHLELSEKVDYNPIDFCFSFKQMDGQPTNTSVQHDSEEFFNIIFDRIENLIKPTPQKYLLQSVFGGKNCSQMVCKECGFIRNRFEEFYNLSLTVKERKSVEESMKKNLEGEVISDYECPGCKKKVDITKRTLFSKTPNVFVIQLQRIIFDFDRFENQKVNSYFEFPETLDLTPYSLNHIMKSEGKLKEKVEGEEEEAADDNNEEEDEFEGLTDEEKKERIEEREIYDEHIRYNENECYEYKLVGVIIHMGTADAGHYYSLINTERFTKDENDDEWPDTSKDKWMEFNDSRVSDYNFEDIKSDCFGGSNSDDGFFGGFFRSSSYGKSAYLLVYEKRFKHALKVLIPEEEKETSGEGLECDDTAKSRFSKNFVPEGAIVHTDSKSNEKFVDMHMKDVKMFVPNRIYKEIWEDNLEFSFEKLIYSKEFYEFVKELMNGTLSFKEKVSTLSIEDQEQVDNVIANITVVGNKIAFEVLAKAYHNYKLNEIAETLIKLYTASDEAVMTTMKAIMEGENSEELLYVFQILFKCNDKISKVNTAKILSVVVNRCFEIEKDILGETETVKVTEMIDGTLTEEEITRPKSLAVRFWDLAIISLKEVGPTNWNRFDQFLSMIRDITIGGENQINMIMKRDGLIDFVDFMLGQNSPNFKPGEKRTRMGNSYSTPNFAPLLEAVSHMVLRCYTPAFNQDSEHKPETFDKEASKHYEISEDDIENFFMNEEFLKIAITNTSEALGKALAHLSYKNLEVSRKVGRIILKTINTSDYEKIKQSMIVAKPYLYIEDEFQRNRTEWILGFGCFLTTKTGTGTTLPRFGVSICNHISEEVYQYLSPLDCTRNNDALLALLWRYRGKMDFYVVNCVNILLEIIVENKFLSEYMFNLDPPTYEYARFTDWFRPYLQKELEKAQRNISYNKSPKKEE
jgi:ubiquitin carboxyl-terminal hydrolase 34